MKTVLLLFLVLFVLNLYGQDDSAYISIKQQIRKLEQGQVDALLRNDIDEMQKHWSKDYIVNNPFNKVVKASEGPIRARTLTYSSFLREIESITIHRDIVIVMGNETIVPTGSSPESGMILHRRFTNIWMNEEGKWLLVARHANVICKN